MNTQPDRIPVLDHGFVRLIDRMGGDLAIVQAARVSYGEESKGERKDRRLIHFLWNNQHDSPFEMAVFKFHVKAPIFVARQWMRHRMGSYNEVSARYRELTDEYYTPEVWKCQDGEVMGEVYADVIAECFTTYRQLLDAGLHREQARMVLPVSTYTEFYWEVNARALINFLQLRDDEHAQWEIQQYARAIKSVFREAMPWTATAVWGGRVKRLGRRLHCEVGR